MNESFLSQFDQLEKERQAMYEQIRRQATETLQKQPDPTSWSVVQVMQHLMRSEQGTVNYINKKLHYRTGIPKANLGTSIRSFLLGLYLRSPIKAKAPAFLAEVDPAQTPEDVWQEWTNTRQQLRELIVAFPEEYEHHAILKHAFAGRLTLAQTLRFLIEHQRRHIGQINRVLAGVAVK
jgi:uncharacterized damage-inducible protein DinB